MLKIFNIPNCDTELIIFNHNALIKKSYKSSENITYSFKPQIFNYISKNNVLVEDETKVTKRKCKNKKKMENFPNNEEFETKFKLEVEALQKCMDFFHNEIKNQQVIQIQPPDSSFDSSNAGNEFCLDAIMNESITFPRFKGSNPSQTFTKFNFNNIDYLIPPMTIFYNYNINTINDINFSKKFDLIILDPPWRNKYIRRLKKSKEKSSAAYEMLNNEEIENLPIQNLLNSNSLVVIWCTNSFQHQNAILNNFLPKWKLKFLTKWFWIKMTTDGQPICNFDCRFGKKQPFETIFIACPEDCEVDFSKELTIKKTILLSIPSLIHSQKPPLIEIIRKDLKIGNPNCLEIFARYLQPNFTSIGLEVLKLMDSRLYNCKG